MSYVNDFVNGGWLPLLLAVLVMATAITLLFPYFSGNNVKQRVKIVTREIDDLKKFERSKLETATRVKEATLRQRLAEKDQGKTSENVQQLAGLGRKLNLDRQANSKLRTKLMRAGYRREDHAIAYLMIRVLTTIGMPFLGYYLTGKFIEEPTLNHHIMGAIGGGIFGFLLPDIMVKNTTTKRQQEILLRFPDALDLLVVCVQSGMTSEAAIRRVAQELERSAPILCEEFHILGAELNYIKDRRVAFKNFAERCGIDQIQDFSNTIIQAEAYGTSVLQALRVQSDELRNDRTQRAENKANSLPAKLTIPLALFMLPVVFAVILTPPLTLALRNF